MKDEEHWIWMVLYCGKMKRTRFHASEETIRRTHPEAVRVEGTMVVRRIAETEADLATRLNHGVRFQEGMGHGLVKK